jgi:hypothetical protein
MGFNSAFKGLKPLKVSPEKKSQILGCDLVVANERYGITCCS